MQGKGRTLMHQQGKAMARRFEKAKSHLLALPLLFSAVLSGAIVLDGNTIMRGDLAGGIEENYISSFTLQDGVLWLFLTVVLYILLMGLTGIYKKYSALFFDKKEKTDHPARLFLVVFLIFLVAWLPYVLTYFPGAVLQMLLIQSGRERSMHIRIITRFCIHCGSSFAWR